MAFRKIPVKIADKKHIADLHRALDKLGLTVKEDEINAKKIEASTTNAIKKFQKDNNLQVDGKLDEKTVASINVSLHDSFVTDSKHRTKKLHNLLGKLDFKIDKTELAEGKSGRTTRKAIEEFQKKNKLPIDGKLSDEVLNKIYEVEIKERLKTKNQQGLVLSKLQKVSRIAKLETKVSDEEFDNKKLGETSKELITEFQKKYKLEPTGKIDKATNDKLDHIAASQGSYVKKLSKPVASELKVVNTPLRINKVSPVVNDAQKALSFLGYKISEKEYNTQTFGKTTRQAVVAFQKKNGLAETGHFEKAEMKVLNKMLLTTNPEAAKSLQTYRIRGSVRNELWERKGNMVVKVFEKAD